MFDRQPVLDGDRLTLRPLRTDDWRALYAVARDPQLWALHPAHERWQKPVFRQFFADALARGGALAILEKHTGEIIGSSQFAQPDPDHPDEVEIGWSFLAQPYWGRGYNAEFKRLMLNHAFAHFERAIFQVGEDNVISRKAMANIGGILTQRTRLSERAGVMVRHVIYEIARKGLGR